MRKRMKGFWIGLLFASVIFGQEPKATYGDCKIGASGATKLTLKEKELVVGGKSAKVYSIELPKGDEVFRRTNGQCFNVVVDNQLPVPTSIHWHGLILPVLEDGVAYITQPPIEPGKSQSYNFEVVQAGTYWMHTHFGLQEQKLLAAPLILEQKEKSPYRDVILFFEGFTFKSIDEVWQNLRKDFITMAKTKGPDWLPPLPPAKKKHTALDLNDVDFDAYLTNQRTAEDAEEVIVEPNEKVRLRFINGSTSSGFHVNLGKLKGDIIAVDGENVIPISFEEFPIAVAQRVDVLVTIPKEGGTFPILAQTQGTDQQTGLILRTKDSPQVKLSSKAKTTVGAITNAIEKDLQAKNPLKPRKVDRVIESSLQGNMKYYVWAINNAVWPNNKPLMVKEGERVEMVFTNQTNMGHPMHLHGHVFQVVEIDGDRFAGAMRDTILVMPFQTVKVQFDANNPGIWAMHCHISYHLWGGMFTVVQYEDYKPPFFPKKEVVDYTRVYGGY